MRKKITSNTGISKNSRRSGYSINALPYSLSIKKPLTVSATNRPFKYMGEADFVESGCGCSSFRDFLLKFLESMEEPLIDDVAYSGMRISKKDIDKSNSGELRCVIRAGKYGYESELYDIKTRRTEIKSQSKCDMLPLLCRIVFKEEHQNCIVIFEKLGPYSCVGVFMRSLRNYVREFFNDPAYNIQYGQIIDLEYALREFNNSVKAIHLVRYVKACDLEDSIGYDNSSEEELKVDLRLSATKRGGLLSVPKKYIAMNFVKGGGSAIVQDTGYEEIGFELQTGGRRQKVVFGSGNMLPVPFDITDSVICSKATGHPEMESFIAATEECLRISSKQLFGGDKK